MSLAVIRTDNDRLISLGSNSDATLRGAIEWVAENGVDLRLIDNSGAEVWYVEADTKTGEDQPFFPVIVHRMSE